MKGLVLKDLYVLKDTLKLYLIFFLVYAYMGIVQNQMGIMYAMVFILSSIMPVTSISYDERSRWDRLANTLPLSRKDIVLSKYSLAFFLLTASILLTAVAYLFVPGVETEEILISLGIMFTISLIYQAVTIPLVFRFGSEKSRIILIAVGFLPVAILYVLSKMQWFGGVDIGAFFERNIRYTPVIAVVLTVAVYIASVILSVKIYSKKDL